jgi:predicted lipoprotein
MLLVGIVAGVNDQRVIHHAAAPFRDAFQCLHHLDQHTAVVLTNLDPDRIVRLIHVPEVVPLLINSQAFPGAEYFASARANRQRVRNA